MGKKGRHVVAQADDGLVAIIPIVIAAAAPSGSPVIIGPAFVLFASAAPLSSALASTPAACSAFFAANRAIVSLGFLGRIGGARGTITAFAVAAAATSAATAT